ncbi:metal-dependent hydrolase [Natribaculum luteum]|uniref:Metal-dependent hydrolase n=1 Tax=Natribaculum luteum TaxID=1586232 RepID=A0ABD5P4Q8_9EURY|nr:metal-dependent hydrolase [Natribaculum luteum]
MWPWEHLAVAYVGCSIVTRVVFGRSPTASEALLVAFGSQFPDLVDKPLAWQFGVLPSGVSLAHSIFLAGPVSLAAVAVAWLTRRPVAGVAFAIGWLSHLVGDVYYPLVYANGYSWDVVLWPMRPAATSPSVGFARQFWTYFDRYLEFLVSPEGMTYLGLEVAVLGGAALLWVFDGTPGLPRPTARSDAHQTDTEP